MYNFFTETNLELLLGKKAEKRNLDQKKLAVSKKIKLNELVVKDHCHKTERYSAAAYQYCNLTVKKNKSAFVSVLFQNFSK